jgi:hypothetical protein
MGSPTGPVRHGVNAVRLQALHRTNVLYLIKLRWMEICTWYAVGSPVGEDPHLGFVIPAAHIAKTSLQFGASNWCVLLAVLALEYWCTGSWVLVYWHWRTGVLTVYWSLCICCCILTSSRDCQLFPGKIISARRTLAAVDWQLWPW